MLELKREVEELEKNVDQIRTEYYREKESVIKLEEQLTSRISQIDSKRLTEQHRKLEVEMETTGNDLTLYKQLYQDLSTKNRYEEMKLVKI
jgi:archaellum component FlaC